MKLSSCSLVVQRIGFYWFLYSNGEGQAKFLFRTLKKKIESKLKRENTRSKEYRKVNHLAGQGLRHSQFYWPTLRLPTSLPSYREGNEKNLLNIAGSVWKDACPYSCIHLFNCGQHSPPDSPRQLGMFNSLWITQSQLEIGLNYMVYNWMNENFVFWDSSEL